MSTIELSQSTWTIRKLSPKPRDTRFLATIKTEESEWLWTLEFSELRDLQMALDVLAEDMRNDSDYTQRVALRIRHLGDKVVGPNVTADDAQQLSNHIFSFMLVQAIDLKKLQESVAADLLSHIPMVH